VTVVSNSEDYEEFLEVMAEEADPEFRKKLEEGRKEFELGRPGTMEDL
jgi:hypothetical protein